MWKNFRSGYSSVDIRILLLSWTTIVVHNRDQVEILHSFLIQHTEKVAFHAWGSSLKLSWPLFSVLKTDQKMFYLLDVDLDDF